MTHNCPNCAGPSDYGPGPCTSCACRNCQGGAFFGYDCSDCGGTGIRQDAPAAPVVPGILSDPAVHVAAAREMMRTMTGNAAVAEAALSARGLRPVSIAHGDAETPEDADLTYKVLPRLARESGTVQSTVGGNDYTTYLFAGPDAEQAAVRFIAAALGVAQSWWRITPTAQPKFR
ncbi:hypothetical protein DQ384_39220 [Sphaerisporangium album]|uniref:Uncharacterized protein n=1 Tax=Sphaerisporangium album TaxID=509200 RepID=A0A367EJF4_9ACTN|nr:hypothetical protein [Sphaerisporangium album]RCG18226.1 hypothetical protein DQ384_39220 [Sphaerisporangium album]